MEKKALLRTFISSFIITLVVFCFVMSFLWVDLMADSNGFKGFFPSLRMEKIDPLIYRLNTAIKEYELDFAPAEKIARTFQSFEAWVLPEEWRVISRTSLYIKDRIASHKKLRQEQEYYKNAGLV